MAAIRRQSHFEFSRSVENTRRRFQNFNPAGLPLFTWLVYSNVTSLHVSKFRYIATKGLFWISHPRKPRKQIASSWTNVRKQQRNFTCLHRWTFGKTSLRQNRENSKFTIITFTQQLKLWVLSKHCFENKATHVTWWKKVGGLRIALDLDVSKMELFTKTHSFTLVSSQQSEELRVVCASYRKSKSYFINGKWQCENKSELFEWEAFNNSIRITDVEFKNNFFSRTLQRYWDRSQRSSFLLHDLTSAGCRQTFTVVFSNFPAVFWLLLSLRSEVFAKLFISFFLSF